MVVTDCGALLQEEFQFGWSFFKFTFPRGNIRGNLSTDQRFHSLMDHLQFLLLMSHTRPEDILVLRGKAVHREFNQGLWTESDYVTDCAQSTGSFPAFFCCFVVFLICSTM